MKLTDESSVSPKRLDVYFLAVKESIRDDPALSRLLERARLDMDVDSGCFYDERNQFVVMDRALTQNFSRLLVPWNSIIAAKLSSYIQCNDGRYLDAVLDDVLLGVEPLSSLRKLWDVFGEKKPDFDRLDAW